MIRYLNFIEKITIELSGTVEMITCAEQYFPGLISANPENAPIYSVLYKGELNQEIDTSNFKLVTPFKATEYLIKNEVNYCTAFSVNETKSSNHVIFKDGKQINVFAHENNSRKLLVRIAREIIFEILLKKGYYPLHASSVYKKNEKAVVFCGISGSGKTSSFLQYILQENANPITNDVSMIKKNREGKIFVVGLPFDITIENDIVKMYGLPINNIIGKSRFTVADFLKTVNKKQIWKAEVEDLFLIQNIKDEQKYDIIKPTSQMFKSIIKNIENECKFNFGDYLCIRGDEKINNNLDYLFSITNCVSGNLFKFFKGISYDELQR